jgi:predicted  nucleic acid-binding Zn-ribbon protein
MKFDKILEYQKLDAEALSLNDVINGSRERAQFLGVRAKHTEAEENKNKLFAEAHEIISQADRTSQKADELSAKIEEIAAFIDKASDINEIDYYVRQLTALSDELSALERDIHKDITKADSIALSYKNFAEISQKSQAAMGTAKVEYDKLMKQVLSKAQPLMEKLKQLEKDIEPWMLKAYMNLRAAKKLPAFVEHTAGDSCCGRCGMDFASDTQSKLKKAGDYAECPNCHRVLYIPD